MGDMNAAVNPDCKQLAPAATLILDWENSGKVRILNNKSEPTNVPYIKFHHENCLDLAIITPGLVKGSIRRENGFHQQRNGQERDQELTRCTKGESLGWIQKQKVVY